MCWSGFPGSIVQYAVRSAEALFGFHTCERKRKEAGLGRVSHQTVIWPIKFLPAHWGALRQNSSSGIILHLTEMLRLLYHSLYQSLIRGHLEKNVTLVLSWGMPWRANCWSLLANNTFFFFFFLLDMACFLEEVSEQHSSVSDSCGQRQFLFGWFTLLSLTQLSSRDIALSLCIDTQI